MTAWDPLNPSFGREHQNADQPSAAFDPSQIGDPLGQRPGAPEIGAGSTRVGGGFGATDPQRRPIGFAPPEETTDGGEYRTELSFKRHRDNPRASALPEQPDDMSQAWETPELGASDTVSFDDASEESKDIKRGSFWRFGRRKEDEDVAAESNADERDASAEVVESEVEVVAEAEAYEFSFDAEEFVSEELPVKRGFWRFGRARSDDAVADTDAGAWDAAEEFEVAAEADEPALDEREVMEPEVVEPEVEVVAEATDEVVGWPASDAWAVDAVEAVEELPVKRGFWRLGRGKASDEAVVDSDAPAWDVFDEVEEPLVVESEVEVVAEADEPPRGRGV